MSVKIVTVTLELTVQVNEPTEDGLDLTCEAMLAGAVNRVGVDATGTGFNYSYEYKKSRRGMTISRRSDK